MAESSVKISSPPEMWFNIVGSDMKMSFDLTSGYTSPEENLFPRSVQVCGTVTTVIWNDGTVTTVKLMDGAIYSEEDAIVFAYFKRTTSDWIDPSVEKTEDDDGKRNWMKAALKTITVVETKEERKAKREVAQKEKEVTLFALDEGDLTSDQVAWIKARKALLEERKAKK